MSLFSSEHPNITTGGLTEFSFHKIERATKAAYVNILQNFFAQTSSAFDISIPELSSYQNKPGTTAIHIRRDFPFGERLFPLIVTSIDNVREKKSFLGSDDLLTIEVETTSEGLTVGTDIFAGMADIDLSLIIAASSPDERSKIAEAIYMCFTHYFRTQFVYLAHDGNLFSVTPSTKSVVMGSESEITDSSKTTLIYVKQVNLSTFIEYQFKDHASPKLYEITNINYDLDNQLNVIEV